MGLKKKMQLWHKVVIGLVCGILFGLLFPQHVHSIEFVGVIFLKLLKMIITPLVYLSIVIGMTSINSSEDLARIAKKSVIAFLLTTTFAILIGLSVAYVLQPGTSLAPEVLLGSKAASKTAAKAGDFNPMDILKNAIPDNALLALSEGYVLQVVFFAFFTGIVINKMGSDKKGLYDAFRKIANLVFKMIHIILEFAPYGTFALIAGVVGNHGVGILQSLGWLIVALLVAMLIQYILFGFMILGFARISPWPFYKKSLEYQAVGLSTTSSKATLPTTMDVCSNKIGMSNNSTSFILPLGAAINMDGTAIYLGVCTLFFAQVFNIHLEFAHYLIIILTSTIGSIGAAGIPGGAVLMMPMVLVPIGIPTEGIALLIGVDRILNMFRTVINLTGDATVALIIDASENTLNKKTYYAPSNKLEEGESHLFE